MTSDHPTATDERALPAIGVDEQVVPEPISRPIVGLLPLTLIAIIVLCFIAAAWTLLAAGA